MSIRDFDPLLKKSAAATTNAAGEKKAASRDKSSETQNSGQPDIPELPTYVTRINVGKAYINVDGGSADQLAQNMQAGFKELASYLKDYTDQLEGFLPGDLGLALAPTLELSAEYCPKDTMALVNSRYLVIDRYRGGCRVEIGYAKDNDPDYAVYVHEMPYQHAPPTSDKFLQRAIDEDYYGIVQRVTDNLRIRMGL